MLHAHPRICPGEWDAHTPLGFWDTNGSLNLGQTTRPNNNQQQKKRIFWIVDDTIPANRWVKLKESEKKDKCLDLARELKKPWNMRVTVKPIVIDALGTVTKRLVEGLKDLEIRGRVETIETAAWLMLARILRRVLETCCHSNSSGKSSANAGVKNSKKNNNNNNNNNYQLLRSGKIWHKVNFQAEFNRFEFRVFLLLD